MKGIDLIKYIYDNNMAETEIVLGVQGYTLDPREDDSDDVQLTKTNDGRLLISDANNYSEEFVAKKYYKVIITETYEKAFKVLAENEETARDIAESEYSDGNVEDFTNTDSPDDYNIETRGEIPKGEENNYDEIKG